MARRALKIITFVLTVVLSASVFGGCSSDSENSIKSVDFSCSEALSKPKLK